MEGKDLERALRLLALHSKDFLRQGRMRLLTRWLAALPEQMIMAYPALRITKIWAFLLTRGPGEAIQLLDQMDAEGGTDPEMRAHVAALRPLLLVMSDRYEDSYPIGKESLAGLPPDLTFTDSVLTNTMANVFSVMGRYGEARELLETFNRSAASLQERHRSPVVEYERDPVQVLGLGDRACGEVQGAAVAVVVVDAVLGLG